MTKETKIKLLQVIFDAGMGGTDREMLDNLKAVIKAIESEGGTPLDKSCTLPNNPLFNDDDARFEKGPVIITTKDDVGPIRLPGKKKAGRPKKVK